MKLDDPLDRGSVFCAFGVRTTQQAEDLRSNDPELYGYIVRIGMHIGEFGGAFDPVDIWSMFDPVIEPLFGGWLMSHADIAGAIHAYRRAGGKVVTVAVDDFTFIQPVYIGDVVTFFCELERIGRSSMVVAVDIQAERPGSPAGTYIRVASARITYVHIDDQRRPREIRRQGSVKRGKTAITEG